jgi:hypothetical protein
MRELHKKKIYKGMVELRDYELRKLLLLKEPVKIWVGDEYMTLRYIDLKTKGKINNTQYSIINEGQKYKLIGFEWKPFKNLDKPVESLGSILSGLNDSQIQELRKRIFG